MKLTPKQIICMLAYFNIKLNFIKKNINLDSIITIVYIKAQEKLLYRTEPVETLQDKQISYDKHNKKKRIINLGTFLFSVLLPAVRMHVLFNITKCMKCHSVMLPVTG